MFKFGFPPNREQKPKDGLIKTTAEGDEIFGEPRPEDNAERARQQAIDEAVAFKKRVGIKDSQAATTPSLDASFRPDDIDERLKEAVQNDFDQAEAMKRAINNPTTNPKS